MITLLTLNALTNRYTRQDMVYKALNTRFSKRNQLFVDASGNESIALFHNNR